jgi:hypothetical protein
VLTALTGEAKPLPPTAPLPASGGVRAAIDATLAAHADAGVPIPKPATQE